MKVIIFIMLSSVYAVISNGIPHLSTTPTIASKNSSVAPLNGTLGLLNENQKHLNPPENKSLATKNKALTARKIQDRDDYPPTHPTILYKEREVSLEDIKSHWYVLYLTGNQMLNKSVLKRGSFTHDLIKNIASKLKLTHGEIILNFLTLSGNDLCLNFTILSSSSSKEKQLLEQITKLVSMDVLSLGGEKFLIHRVLESKNKPHIIKPIHSLSYSHPYSHTVSLLQDDAQSHLQHERVQLVLYLTIAGLCIFFVVFALSFLTIRFMTTGTLKVSDEDYEDEDLKISFPALEDSYSQPHDHESNNNVQDDKFPGKSHCNKCEIEKQDTSPLVNFTKSSGHPQSFALISPKRNYFLKWIPLIQYSRNQIDVKY
ncbi:uncharacterized protein [Lepeophtheirus salmonis]|uniref:uncharacterized protein n=1 Tax=Lepeophtheirus salmonis TaxID=72036 RepID=UPI001AEABC8E|nr:uncharacterized protein LOC121129904 [Lepeophtheirus salmonis]